MPYSGEKMEKLTNVRDGKELFVTVEHRRGQPFKLARVETSTYSQLVEPPPQLVDQPPQLLEPPPPLFEQPPPLVEPPPPLMEHPLMPKPRNRRTAEQPPPSPKGVFRSGPKEVFHFLFFLRNKKAFLLMSFVRHLLFIVMNIYYKYLNKFYLL